MHLSDNRLSSADFGPNDHREDGPHFIRWAITTTEFTLHVVSNLFRFNHLKTRECGGEGWKTPLIKFKMHSWQKPVVIFSDDEIPRMNQNSNSLIYTCHIGWQRSSYWMKKKHIFSSKMNWYSIAPKAFLQKNCPLEGVVWLLLINSLKSKPECAAFDHDGRRGRGGLTLVVQRSFYGPFS